MAYGMSRCDDLQQSYIRGRNQSLAIGLKINCKWAERVQKNLLRKARGGGGVLTKTERAELNRLWSQRFLSAGQRSRMRYLENTLRKAGGTHALGKGKTMNKMIIGAGVVGAAGVGGFFLVRYLRAKAAVEKAKKLAAKQDAASATVTAIAVGPTSGDDVYRPSGVPEPWNPVVDIDVPVPNYPSGTPEPGFFDPDDSPLISGYSNYGVRVV